MKKSPTTLPKYVLKTLNKTCSACPAQWEGKLYGGRMVYIRYRWGYLSVDISLKPTSNLDDALNGETIYAEQVGHGLDGFMELEELIEHVSHLLDFKKLV